MKRFLMLPVMFFLVLVALPLSAPAGSATGPKMVMPEKHYDFKDVGEGVVIEHTFQVTNQGTEVLQIKNVNPG
jgi:hypothetical protein